MLHKNKYINIFLICSIFFFFFCFLTQEAKAFEGCVPEKDSGKYIEAVVDCVKNPVRVATINMMKKLSDIFRPVVLALFAVAIALFGISILDAGGSVGPPIFLFIMRLGLVSFFSYNLGGFAEKILGTATQAGILDQLLKLVTTSDYSPWKQMDLFIGQLFGFATGKELKDGVIGLINGSATVKIEGAMLAGVGIYTLWTVLGFLFESVFLYISSIMTIALLIIISPLIIPFAIFNYGWKQYVTHWFNLLISVMITPVLAFAILWIFVGDGTTSNKGVFKELVDEVFAAMPNNGKDYLEKNLHTNQSFLTLLQNVDAEQQKAMAEKKCLDEKGQPITDCKTETITPAVNPMVNPAGTASASHNIKHDGLNFGADDIKIKKALFIAFLHLLIFSFIMKAMMQQLQLVASSIAGVAADRAVSAVTSSPLTSMGITPKIGQG